MACPGSDELDFGAREECVACWHSWLKSDALQAYIKMVSKQGMSALQFLDNITGTSAVRNVKPSLKDFETALTIVINSYKIGISTLEKQWKNIADEDEKGITQGNLRF